MTIRPMAPRDLEAVLQIEQVAFPFPWRKENFLEELKDEAFSTFLVAQWQDQIVGYYGFHLVFDEIDLVKIAVAPGYQRRGIGSLLMADFIVRGASFARLTLDVDVRNEAALALYHKHLFRRCGLRKGYYQDGGDALIMERFL